MLFFHQQLKGFEFVKAIHLDPVPFDIEHDLLTPTYKKKRPQLLKYYQVMVINVSQISTLLPRALPLTKLKRGMVVCVYEHFLMTLLFQSLPSTWLSSPSVPLILYYLESI